MNTVRILNGVNTVKLSAIRIHTTTYFISPGMTYRKNEAVKP